MFQVWVTPYKVLRLGWPCWAMVAARKVPRAEPWVWMPFGEWQALPFLIAVCLLGELVLTVLLYSSKQRGADCKLFSCGRAYNDPLRRTSSPVAAQVEVHAACQDLAKIVRERLRSTNGRDAKDPVLADCLVSLISSGVQNRSSVHAMRCSMHANRCMAACE